MTSPWLDAEHERMWQQVISKDLLLRLKALDFWARRLDMLPAPLMFSVSKEERLKGEWQRVVRRSTRYCDCGEYRWLFPSHSVHFHPPANPTPITIGAGKQLALGPWGAGTQQTSMQLSVEHGYFVRHILPYSNMSQEELLALGVDVIAGANLELDADGRQHVSGISLGGGTVVRESLEKIARDLAELQRPINGMMLVRDEDKPNEGINWVMYWMTKADLTAGTLDILPSATVQVMDRSNRAAVHICKS